MPEVSVIIPFHNREDWTEEAVKSVLDQSFQDFEIILVDDGSSENHQSRFEKLDNRIQYIRQEQRGAAAARNVGIRIASGNFIAFLNSDDLFLPEKLEIQIGIFRNHPDLLLVHSSYFRMDQAGNKLDLVSSGTLTGMVYPRIYINCHVPTPTVVVRKSVFEQLEFDERARFGEDVILWTKISKLAEIKGVERPLALVRIHGKNAARNPDKQIEGLKNILNFGIRTDSDLGFIQRQQVESSYYQKLAYWHARKKDYASAVSSMMISFLKCPFRKDFWNLILFSFPKKLKQKISKDSR